MKMLHDLNQMMAASVANANQMANVISQSGIQSIPTTLASNFFFIIIHLLNKL